MTSLSAAAPVEHGPLELVPTVGERPLHPLDEGAEIRVVRPGVHLRDEEDLQDRQLDDSGTVSAQSRAFFPNRLAAGGGLRWTQRGGRYGLGPLGVVRSEHVAQLLADLADRGPCPQG